jgi:putative transposase
MQRLYQYRRHLPHYQHSYRAIFVTSCTHQRWILPPAARTIVLECCRWADGKRFELHGAVVRPDHFHMVLTPLYDDEGLFTLNEIMQGIKSSSAHRINRLLQRKGQVWQHESFDRAFRKEESIQQKLEYISENALRAGLVKTARDYPWLWLKAAQTA